MDGRLVGYVVGSADPAELRAALAAWLPEYMQPAVFVPIDAVPLTPSGKADRRALPAPVSAPVVAEYEAPDGEVEEMLAGIWAEVLGVERVGVTNDFFALGGDSVTAIRIVARVKAVGLVATPQSLFRAPTVRRLAALCQDAAPSTTAPVEMARAEATSRHRTTALQRRLLRSGDPAVGMLHLVLPLATAVDPDIMRDAWQRALDDHPILRTSFVPGPDGELVQVVHPAGVTVPFVFRDLSGRPGS